MKLKTIIAALACALALAACSEGQPDGGGAPPAASMTPGPLPDNAFRAQLTLPSPPARLRAGQKETIQVRVKNVSDAQWYARGAPVNTNPDNRFYVAAGDRWLAADGQTLVSDMDGRYGLQRDLRPGEEEDVPLVITAPKEPGEYVLEVDLIQEQVSWFRDKGSQTTKTKVTVVR